MNYRRLWDYGVFMKFGRYKILEELGAGGFGTVYKAEDEVLGRIVALKVLHPSLLIDQSFLARFRNEARLAAQLEHPNLIPVHDFGEIDGRYVITMAYMAGGSLKQLLAEEGKLTPERASHILEDVCQGLDYAHGKGIIHRDLKPGNILLDENGRARIGDLGFARVISDASSISMTASGTLVGTPAYMAPELWRNKPASVQTDIYSLGCILYEMLTGEVLFEGTSPAEVMTMHVIDGPQFRHGLPAAWRELLNKCLSRDYQDRYSSVQQFLEILKDGKECTDISEDLVNPLVDETASPDQDEFIEGVQENQASKLEKTELDLKSIDSKPVPEEELLLSALNVEHRLSNDFDPGPLVLQTGAQKNLSTFTIDSQRFEEGEELIGITKPWLIPLLIGVGLIVIIMLILHMSKHTTKSFAQLQLKGPEFISSITYSPDGDLIAIGTDMGIYLYDSQTLAEVETTFYGMDINSVVWSPDGTMLASASQDGTLSLWDTKNESQLWALEAHTDPVYQVAWSPDGTMLATASDKTIGIWDSKSGSQLRVMEGHSDWDWVTSISWSPDSNRLASGSSDGTIRIWDVKSGSQLRVMEGHSSLVTSISWSPEGSRLASGSHDGTIRIWDSENGSKLRVLRQHRDGVRNVVWSPNGSRLASASYDDTIRVWDAERGSQLRVMEDYSHSMVCVAWSIDGTILASGGYGGIIRFWEAP